MTTGGTRDSTEQHGPGEGASQTTASDWNEELYRGTMKVLDSPADEESWLVKLAWLLGSLILAAVAFWWLGWGLRTAILILAITFFHELGHYLGMRLFGYRNTKIIFIPFFGGVAVGFPPRSPVWQHAIIILLGPMPGILIGALLMVIYSPDYRSPLGEACLLLIAINVFNLLPVRPLDGGQLLHILFFARRPWLAAGFTLLGALGLAWLAWMLWIWGFAIVAGLVLLGVIPAYRDTAAGARVRAAGLVLPDSLAMLDDRQQRALFAHTLKENPGTTEPNALADAFRVLHEAAVRAPAGAGVTSLLLLVYLSGWVLAIFGLIYPEAQTTWQQSRANWEQSESIRQITRQAHDDARTGRNAEALEGFQKALAALDARAKEALAKTPGRNDTLYNLSQRHRDVALQALKMQQQSLTLEHLRASAAILEALVKAEPSIIRWYDEWRLVLSDLVRAYVTFGQSAEARALLDTLVKDFEARTKIEPSEANNARFLADLHVMRGYRHRAEKQHAEAMQNFQAALAIREKLAGDGLRDSRELSNLHRHIAEAFLDRGDTTNAIQYFQNGLRVREQGIERNWTKATKDAGDRPAMQSSLANLSDDFNQLIGVLLDLKQIDEAVKVHRQALRNYERLIELELMQRQASRDTLWLDSLSKSALLAREFPKALAAADRSLAIDSSNLSAHAIRAHALMFLDRADEAKAIYAAHKGRPVGDRKIPWERHIQGDFSEFRRNGLTHPVMPEIEAMLSIATPGNQSPKP